MRKTPIVHPQNRQSEYVPDVPAPYRAVTANESASELQATQGQRRAEGGSALDTRTADATFAAYAEAPRPQEDG